MNPAGPSVLSSFVGLAAFKKKSAQNGWPIRSWVLDSGAYSAANSGAVIDLGEFAEAVIALRETAEAPEVVFSLDIIGDAEGSWKNFCELRTRGVVTVPTFHYGSEMKHLDRLLAENCPIAIGGLVGRGAGGHGTALHVSARLRFVGQVFERAWPRWVHGFGCCDPRLLQSVPFASADSTTWLYGLQRYGILQRYAGIKSPRMKTKSTAFVSSGMLQVDHYLQIERETRAKWGAELRRSLGCNFDLRLAVTAGAGMDILAEHLTR